MVPAWPIADEVTSADPADVDAVPNIDVSGIDAPAVSATDDRTITGTWKTIATSADNRSITAAGSKLLARASGAWSRAATSKSRTIVAATGTELFAGATSAGAIAISQTRSITASRARQCRGSVAAAEVRTIAAGHATTGQRRPAHWPYVIGLMDRRPIRRGRATRLSRWPRGVGPSAAGGTESAARTSRGDVRRASCC